MARVAEQIWDEHWREGIESRQQLLGGAYTRHAYAALRRFVGASDRSILEAGCGTGRFCYLLAKDRPDATVVGLDSSEQAVARARGMFALPNLSFARGDLFRLPYGDATWDVVFNEGVIEHFPLRQERSYVAAVREMARAAKAGGKVIIAVPSAYCFPHVLWKMAVGSRFEYGYEKSFRPDELRQVMRQAGLRIEGVVGFAPMHGLIRYERILPRWARRLTRWEPLYARTPCWLRRVLDVFGFEFFMLGVKA